MAEKKKPKQASW